MALNSNIKVEMPPHCVKVPKNGTTYIQYTLRAYRDAKGRPTSSRIAIGKLYTHSDETAQGKVFCAFLSLIVLSEMLNGLSGYMREQKLTFRKILLELGKVKCGVSKSGLRTLLNPPSKTVRGIFDCLGIPQDSFSRFV